MNTFGRLWHAIKTDFRIKFGLEKKSCDKCDYMRKLQYGRDAGKWKCCASCGNDVGVVCGAWFPKDPDKIGKEDK